MKQRPLTLDDIPVVGGGIGGQHLGCTRREVRYHRIHRNAGTADHDAGLTGRSELRVDSSPAQGARQREGSVLLPERAVGSDSEQSLAAALAAAGDRNTVWRGAHLDQAASQARSE